MAAVTSIFRGSPSPITSPDSSKDSPGIQLFRGSPSPITSPDSSKDSPGIKLS